MELNYEIIHNETFGTAWMYFEIDIYANDHSEKGISYVLKVLKEISIKNGLIPDEKNWQSISFNKSRFFLENGFRFDLAYTSYENDSKQNALNYSNKILEKFISSDTVCLSNTSCDLWGKSSSWNSITNHTFDLGILLTDFKKIILTVFVGED